VFVAKLNPTGSALLYATHLGGTDEDRGIGIAVDGTGNAYVTGSVQSRDFPTLNALRPTRVGGPTDAFVAKLGPDGALVYSTYLGNTSGDSTDSGRAIAVDAAGHAYVTGDGAYVKKLNPAGSALVYDTRLSDTASVKGRAIAVDAAGNAYIAGNASTSVAARFQVTSALQPAHGGGPFDGDAIVAKLGPTGSPVYATFLGGGASEAATGITVDAAGHAYVTGTTSSTGFPVTEGALQPRLNSDVGFPDAFVTKLNPGGTALVYSTYLGGSNNDGGNAIAVDTAGNAYITGSTASTGPGEPFPTTPDAFQPRHHPSGPNDAFLAKLNPSGTALAYGTYLGGDGHDEGVGIALDAHGDVYVAGFTRSTDLPVASDALQRSQAGEEDAFVVKLPAPGMPTAPSATATPAPATPPATPTAGPTGGQPTPIVATVVPPAPGTSKTTASIKPDTPTTLALTLPTGQQAGVTVGGAVLGALQAAQPEVSTADVAFDVAPVPVKPVEVAVYGGGQIVLAGDPVDVKVELRDAAGNQVGAAPEVAGAIVEITLPLQPPAEPGARFHWLHEVYEDGEVLGWAWTKSEVRDEATGTVTIPLSVAELQGTLFLPVSILPGFVQNHDPLVHVWSGPTRQAVDFGFAGPQFTTFSVVAPQVGLRIFVYSPVVDNYAWIDAPGVGPSGPP
jgi:hypothetical protein